LALVGVGLVRGHLAVVRHEALRARADDAIPQPARCSALATVDTSPVRVRDVANVATGFAPRLGVA